MQPDKERPIIQVSLRDFENRKHEIAKDLWKAATEIGFFYLCDTGISEVSSHHNWVRGQARSSISTYFVLISSR